MRTTLEFEASGGSYADLQQKVEEFIATFLSVDPRDVAAKADAEMHVTSNEKTFTAKVYVRIK